MEMRLLMPCHMWVKKLCTATSQESNNDVLWKALSRKETQNHPSTEDKDTGVRDAWTEVFWDTWSLSWLSVWLQLRSWCQGPGPSPTSSQSVVWPHLAPHPAGSLLVPLPLSLPLLMLSLSLKYRNKIFQIFLKKKCLVKWESRNISVMCYIVLFQITSYM